MITPPPSGKLAQLRKTQVDTLGYPPIAQRGAQVIEQQQAKKVAKDLNGGSEAGKGSNHGYGKTN